MGRVQRCPGEVAEVIDAAGVTVTHPGNAGAVVPRILSKPGVNFATRKQGFTSMHVELQACKDQIGPDPDGLRAAALQH